MDEGGREAPGDFGHGEQDGLRKEVWRVGPRTQVGPSELAKRATRGERTGGRGSTAPASLNQLFFFRFFGFGTGSSRVVILTSSLSHVVSSIWSSIKKIGLAPG